MNNNLETTERKQAHTLLACFFNECEKHFRFLRLNHDFEHISGLVEYKNNRQIIKPLPESLSATPLVASVRFEKDMFAYEICFDYRNSHLLPLFFYQNIHRLHWSHLAAAAKKDETALGVYSNNNDTQILKANIEALSNAYLKHANDLLFPSEKLIDKALRIKATRLEHSIREQYKAQKDYASQQAARAFLEQNYKAVITYLRPYERDLGPADRKKLELSLKKLLL